MGAIETEAPSHNAPASIATHVESCLRAFSKLYSDLQSSSRANLYQIRLSDVKDELGRFRIWSGNIDAHRTGRSSLSYRLRDASHLKVMVIGLLRDLEETLWDASKIIHGEKVPWEELSDSDSDSTISENDPALEEAANGPLQTTSELQQLMSEVVEVITCLLRLSMAIRNPAPHDQFMESGQINTSYFESFDIGHVQAKFPDAEGYLINRLGKAISRRRQYLKYRDEHHKKLAQSIEDVIEAPKPVSEPIGTEFAPIEAAPTEINPESTVAPSTPLALKAPTTHIDLHEDVYSEDGLSQTSYATSANESIELRPPPIPKEAQDGKPFECPLCFMIISIRNSHSWKKHVYRDLRPYICTFEDCKTPDCLFETRYQWFDHEMQTHRRWWQCVEGCDKPCYSKSVFETHIQQAHPDLSRGGHLPALMRMCERKASMDTPVDCPLCCQPFLSLMQLRRHMGQHHEQLALFAIPSNFEETEDDSEAESNNEAEKESIGSGRTNSEVDEDETASNQQGPHDGRTKESEELPFAKASPRLLPIIDFGRDSGKIAKHDGSEPSQQSVGHSVTEAAQRGPRVLATQSGPATPRGSRDCRPSWEEVERAVGMLRGAGAWSDPGIGGGELNRLRSCIENTDDKPLPSIAARPNRRRKSDRGGGDAREIKTGGEEAAET